MDIIDVADLDCVFLTYNEPEKEEYWVKIQNMVPWAVRVDGVHGSDAAHKAAADASTTDRFILIDGDNMPDPEFFNQQLTLTNLNKNKVFRWKARNEINGLMYGNGGMSCWTKEFIYNMKTHEASDGADDTAIEFCFDPQYWAMYDCWSTTYPNQTEEQSWRAGFREGVKMCLNKGSKPTMEEFEQAVVSRNLDHLCVWMTVGDDVKNGQWARAGAMLGTYLTMLGSIERMNGNPLITDFDYRTVQDFTALSKIWHTFEDYVLATSTELAWGGHVNGIDIAISQMESRLRQRLGLKICSMDATASAFFKRHVNKNFHNKGIMVTEIDVIREIEGW